MIIGEHGDSEVPVWSVTNIAGVPLNDFCELRGHKNHKGSNAENLRGCQRQCLQNNRAQGRYILRSSHGGYKNSQMSGERRARGASISVPLHGRYGIDGVHLSIPTVLGKNGIETVLEMPLNGSEQVALIKSADALKAIIAEVEKT